MPIKKLDIRVCPDSAVSGSDIDITMLVERYDGYNKGLIEVCMSDGYEDSKRVPYEVKFTENKQDVMVSYRVPSVSGAQRLNVYANGRLMDSEAVDVKAKAGITDSITKSISDWQWRIPGTDIILKFG
jgi:hypothetical protein